MIMKTQSARTHPGRRCILGLAVSHSLCLQAAPCYCLCIQTRTQSPRPCILGHAATKQYCLQQELRRPTTHEEVNGLMYQLLKNLDPNTRRLIESTCFNSCLCPQFPRHKTDHIEPSSPAQLSQPPSQVPPIPGHKSRWVLRKGQGVSEQHTEHIHSIIYRIIYTMCRVPCNTSLSRGTNISHHMLKQHLQF